MTDQPSTEDVRYGYRTGVTVPILPVEAGDAFDAWLAAHDREVAAKALREASEDMASARVSGPWHWNLSVNGDPDITASPDVWLRFRADRIGAGDE